MKRNDINITPVKKYAPPKYPTMTSAKSDPKLLRKLPSRWEKNAAVVAAVGMLGAMSLTSCGVIPSANKTGNKVEETPEIADTGELAGDVIFEIPTEQDVTYETEETDEPFTLMGLIEQPVFTTEQEVEEETFMLEGMVAPPLFTSEQEVTDETEDWFVLAGIPAPPDFTSEQEVTTNFFSIFNGIMPPLPETGEVAPPCIISEEYVLTMIKNLAEAEGLDLIKTLPEDGYTPIQLYNKEKQIGIVYDYDVNLKEDTYITSDGVSIGQFNGSNAILTGDEQQLEEDLRAQVRDFIEWLQGQGII